MSNSMNHTHLINTHVYDCVNVTICVCISQYVCMCTCMCILIPYNYRIQYTIPQTVYECIYIYIYTQIYYLYLSILQVYMYMCIIYIYIYIYYICDILSFYIYIMYIYMQSFSRAFLRHSKLCNLPELDRTTRMIAELRQMNQSSTRSWMRHGLVRVPALTGGFHHWGVPQQLDGLESLEQTIRF